MSDRIHTNIVTCFLLISFIMGCLVGYGFCRLQTYEEGYSFQVAAPAFRGRSPVILKDIK